MAPWFRKVELVSGDLTLFAAGETAGRKTMNRAEEEEVRGLGVRLWGSGREFISNTTSMITDEDAFRELLCY